MPTTIVNQELAELCFLLRNPSEVLTTERHVRAARALITLTTTLREGTEAQVLNVPLNTWMRDHFCAHTTVFKQEGELLEDQCATDGAIVFEVGGERIPILFRYRRILV